MLRAGIIGAGGFTGEKLLELLLRHPQVKLTYLSSLVDKPLRFSEMFPRFSKRVDLICVNLDREKACKLCDLIFLALPHRVSFTLVPFFLKKKKTVIDLSADYRLKDHLIYQAYYGEEHRDLAGLKKAVYGLPELYRTRIKKAQLIANPGCYPTVSILSLFPLFKKKLIDPTSIVIDAKSGVTGAGRRSSLDYHYAHLSGNVYPYRPFTHQHLPEILQILKKEASGKIKLRFTPHLLPLERGIIITVYASLRKSLKKEEIKRCYLDYYRKEPFIRLFDGLVQLKNVIDTNFCDIGFEVEKRDILISAAIDNLIKGAAGQAVQNMNIIYGFKESTSLIG